jgi:integrase
MAVRDISIFPYSTVDSDDFCRLYMYVSINNKPGWFPTGVKVHKDAWDRVNKVIKSDKMERKLRQKLTGDLDKRKGDLQRVFDELDYERVAPTVEEVRRRYNAVRKHQPLNVVLKKPEYRFDEYWDMYIKDRRSTCSDKGYLRKFKSAMGHIKTVVDRDQIYFTDITIQFYYDLLNHLFETLERESNTASGIIKKICSVMKSALSDPRTRHQDIPIDFQQFKDTYVKPKPFFLDWETDIACLEEFEPLEEDEPYRDFFLFQCYTGLRHSDAYNAKPENFIKRKDGVYLDCTVIKTKLDHNIKMAGKAATLLKQWNYRVPRCSESDLNVKIKSIALAAGKAWEKKGKKSGLLDLVEKVRFRGSERVRDMLPKYSMITTHTARRTFGRRWLEVGEDIRSLQIYYGHSNIKQTEDYIGWKSEHIVTAVDRVVG